MVQHASPRRHAGRRDDDLRIPVRRNRLRSFDIVGVLGDTEDFTACRVVQFMIAWVSAHHVSGIGSHRTVEEDGDGCETTGSPQRPEIVEKLLRAANGEGRYDECPAALHSTFRDHAQRLGRIIRRVNPVAIGRFDHDVVGLTTRDRVWKQRILVAPDIAGEDQAAATPLNHGMRGAQDMAGMAETQRQAIGQRNGLVERYGREMFDSATGA